MTQRIYIWCYAYEGSIYPFGDAKTLEYAMECKGGYPGGDRVRLFKLVEVDQNGDEL